MAFLDVRIGSQNMGRLEIDLFEDTCPITSQNFSNFCSGNNEKQLQYSNCNFFRIIPGQFAQTGDLITNDGKNNVSTNGGFF